MNPFFLAMQTFQGDRVYNYQVYTDMMKLMKVLKIKYAFKLILTLKGCFQDTNKGW